jgi:hypothetical protein
MCRLTYANSILSPHTHMIIGNVTMNSLLYIQSLGVTIESPPQVNINLGFSCGCEAPTQAHKSHHQTHEAPIQIQGGFYQTEFVMWFPRRFPHSQHLGSCENTCLKLQKSIGDLCLKHQYNVFKVI